jgi:hypothetical protein
MWLIIFYLRYVPNTEAGEHGHVACSSRPLDRTSERTQLDECRSFYKTSPIFLKINPQPGRSTRGCGRGFSDAPPAATGTPGHTARSRGWALPLAAPPIAWSPCCPTPDSGMGAMGSNSVLGRLSPHKLLEDRYASPPRQTVTIAARCCGTAVAPLTPPALATCCCDRTQLPTQLWCSRVRAWAIHAGDRCSCASRHCWCLRVGAIAARPDHPAGSAEYVRDRHDDGKKRVARNREMTELEAADPEAFQTACWATGVLERGARWGEPEHQKEKGKRNMTKLVDRNDPAYG